ncbi:cytochrome P450 [Deminuibacter soli]|uniref:Cytochrome P450 n=1 Tax=Deminuibacter soli TaxID=2291815 RepID=A0A3E1ND51_9BACT|nr:cytochrome P450 [Deminuibacter soli]RFM25744.1 cytochrome P450 [Deminuibacter soli]
MSMSSYFKGWATSTPVLRTAFSVLRNVAPVARFGKTIVVTRYNDVQDVLLREDAFTVHEIDGYKMEVMGNPFVLGMDASEEATRDRAMLQQVIKREDLVLIRNMIRSIAADLIQQAAPKKQIDTVDVYARLAAVRLVAQYFGVPADEKKMMEWQRAIFNEAFVNLNNDKTVHGRGMVAAKEVAVHIAGLITQRKQQQQPLEDNVLNRLIAKQADTAWLDDDAVRRNILCILGVVENTSKVVTHVIDQLLRRPEVLAQARQAAVNGDMDTVHDYAFEALRFNPHNPVILRFCKNGAVIGSGTPHEKKIPAGSTIYAATLSAMFDPSTVAAPNEFRPGRKVDCMHFGYGPHLCTGRYISEVTVPELVAGLLKLPNLRRAPGSAGRIVYEDLVFPKSLTLQFD